MRDLTRFFAVGLLLAACWPVFADAADPDPMRFEAELKAFDRKDAASPPVPGKVLFVGSSSIRLWNVEKDFPELDAVNRGFGGSHISDSVALFDRLVAPYVPSKIVFYAGDNDIDAGKTAEQVRDDFAEFLGKVRERFPECPVIYISIKPSIKRWGLWETMKTANGLIGEVAKRDGNATVLDISDVMLGADGEPKPELFAPDGLHLSRSGYEAWAAKLRPLLADAPTKAEDKKN